jgi:hypothetical protein
VLIFDIIFRIRVSVPGITPNAYDSVAECYLTRGNNAKAKEYYELAIQKNPGKTDYEKCILQNSKDKLKELSQ